MWRKILFFFILVLNIFLEPAAVESLMLAATGATSFTVGWSPPSIGSVDQFRIEVVDVETSGRVLLRNVNSPTTQTTVDTDLNPASRYIVAVSSLLDGSSTGQDTLISQEVSETIVTGETVKIPHHNYYCHLHSMH